MGTTNRFGVFKNKGHISPEVKRYQAPTSNELDVDTVIETGQVLPMACDPSSLDEVSAHFGGSESIDQPLGNPVSSDWESSNPGFTIYDGSSSRARRNG